MAAVIRGRGRRQLYEDQAELFVRGNAAPRAQIAGVLPGILSPRLVAELARLRHDVERPEAFTRTRVIGTHVLGNRFLDDTAVACTAGDARDDDDVAHRDGASGPTVLPSQRLVSVQAHSSLIAELAVELPGRDVDRVQILASRREHALLRAVAPINDASRALPVRLFLCRVERLLLPNCLARTRMDRPHQSDRVRRVEHATDHERGRAEISAHPKLRIGFLELGLDGGAAPKDFELVHVVPIDLIERRISREGLVTAEVVPFTSDGLLLGARRARADSEKEHKQGLYVTTLSRSHGRFLHSHFRFCRQDFLNRTAGPGSAREKQSNCSSDLVSMTRH